jgi:hypothetical protein
MTITKLGNSFALDSMTFEIKGVQFLLTGVHTDRFGNVVDHIKNLQNGKRSEMSRQRLVEVLTKNGHKIKHWNR